jgi:two-component system phosphate regulon sensor histidine kinase PhoR
LETARIDSHRTSKERQTLNLADLVEVETGRQRPLLEGKEQTLSIIGEEDLPVWGNQGQLRQVIRNLLDNAIKYTRQGGHIICEGQVLEAGAYSTTVRPHGPQARSSEPIEAVSGDQWAALHVIDNGSGIEEADLPWVFQRFYRAKSQEGVPGTGLGLSIAKDLVELHGGHLTVASTPGEGSTFSILLPLSTCSTSSGSRPESESHSERGSQFSSKRIEQAVRQVNGSSEGS